MTVWYTTYQKMTKDILQLYCILRATSCWQCVSMYTVYCVCVCVLCVGACLYLIFVVVYLPRDWPSSTRCIA